MVAVRELGQQFCCLLGELTLLLFHALFEALSLFLYEGSQMEFLRGELALAIVLVVMSGSISIRRLGVLLILLLGGGVRLRVLFMGLTTFSRGIGVGFISRKLRNRGLGLDPLGHGQLTLGRLLGGLRDSFFLSFGSGRWFLMKE